MELPEPSSILHVIIREFKRHDANAIVSERALREIYLKGFEIAVKQGGAYSIMSTYGPVNGLWTAGSYDLPRQPFSVRNGAIRVLS